MSHRSSSPAFSRRAVLTTGTGASLALGLGVAGTAAATDNVDGMSADPDRRIEFLAWQPTPAGAGREALSRGRRDGCRVTRGGLVFGDEAGGTLTFTDPFVDNDDGTVTAVGDELPGGGVAEGTPVDYETATWLSRQHVLPFPATEVIASYNASTPEQTWIRVEVQVTTRAVGDDGAPSGAQTTSTWFTMANWCEELPADGGAVHRATVDGQGDANADVYTDTVIAASGRGITGYRIRVTLLRPVGAEETPEIHLVGAMASAVPDVDHVEASTPGTGAGHVVDDVPTLSQMVHRGRYTQWGGGGAAWCSPTSVAMSLLHHGVGPSEEDLAWVEPQTDAIVPFSARGTWDHQYDGAGNWPFSAAYAARYGLAGYITRLPDLTAMEPYFLAGVPLVASVHFDESELDGAGYSTNGHLMLVVGFTEDGDVVVNDPASHFVADDDQVRVTYDREQFENVWITASGGIVYVIAPPDVELPSGVA